MWLITSGCLLVKVNQPNGIDGCHFHLHMSASTRISHKAAKSMDKLISQLCVSLQPAVCLSRGCGAV